MLEVAQQLSYYLSVVDGGASSRLVQFGQQLASIALIGQSVKASVESMLAPLNRIGAQWSQRETQINNITRSLRQYGYVGKSIAEINEEINRSMPGASQADRAAAFTAQYNRQFAEGRDMARGTIATMTQLAAVLPGEVDDYMQSFSQSLPFLSRVGGMSLSRAANISSRMTAGGMSAGNSGQEVSRDLQQFLSVGPSIADDSWTQVWANYARNLRTHAKLSADQVRAMTPQQRVLIAEDIASQLDPVMGATGDSFEAMLGTLKSAQHELGLAFSQPIFEEFKRLIGSTNNQLGRFYNRIEAAGTWIGGLIATHGVHKLVELVDDLDLAIYKFASFTLPRWAGNLTEYTSMLARNGNIAKNYFGQFIGGGSAIVKRQMDAHGVSGGDLVKGAVSLMASRGLAMIAAQAGLGPWGFIIGSILSRMLMNGQLSQTFLELGRAATSLAPSLLALFSIVSRVWFALVDLAGVLLSTILPILVTGLGTALNFVVIIVTAAFNLLANVILMVAYPVIVALVVGFQGAATVVQAVVALFRLLVGVLGTGSTTTADFVDSLRWCTEKLDDFTRSLQEDTNYLLHEAGLMTDAEYDASHANLAPGERTRPAWIDELERAINNIKNAIAPDGRAGNQPPAPRPHTNQDFRYSRFDITQRFAEGFDPDRVASAFADELAGLAENRLESGFQPAFSSNF